MFITYVLPEDHAVGVFIVKYIVLFVTAVIVYVPLNKESIPLITTRSFALYPWLADVIRAAENPDKYLFDTVLAWENVKG